MLHSRQLRSIGTNAGEPVISTSQTFHLKNCLFQKNNPTNHQKNHKTQPQKNPKTPPKRSPSAHLYQKLPALQLPFRILQFSDLKCSGCSFAGSRACPGVPVTGARRRRHRGAASRRPSCSHRSPLLSYRGVEGDSLSRSAHPSAALLPKPSLPTTSSAI